MKKIIFLILLFILLATVAMGASTSMNGTGTRSARADLADRHAGH